MIGVAPIVFELGVIIEVAWFANALGYTLEDVREFPHREHRTMPRSIPENLA